MTAGVLFQIKGFQKVYSTLQKHSSIFFLQNKIGTHSDRNLKTLKFRSVFRTRSADVFADGPVFRTRSADVFADGPVFRTCSAPDVFADGTYFL